jgi:hypothetical protein
MGYDPDFYARYEAYVTEPRVRLKHDKFLRVWNTIRVGPADLRTLGSVIDLGCGRAMEYQRFHPGAHYTGFDQNAVEMDVPRRRVVQADYRDPEFLNRKFDLPPTHFVSLFSAEITAPAHTNKALYERLFTRIPTIQAGLVSGFYYTDARIDQNPVREAGGLVSWQTLNHLEQDRSEVYDEVRLTAAVPSDLFGEDVIEIWRVFTRARV